MMCFRFVTYVFYFCLIMLLSVCDIAAKGVVPATSAEYVPTLRENVCFIVAAVLVNEEGHVLMMQEAKR